MIIPKKYEKAKKRKNTKTDRYIHTDDNIFETVLAIDYNLWLKL